MMQNNKHATVINALLVDFCVKTIKKIFNIIHVTCRYTLMLMLACIEINVKFLGMNAVVLHSSHSGCLAEFIRPLILM